MKLNIIDEADRPLCHFAVVFLDDVQITRYAISADEEAGCVVVLKLLDDNHIALAPSGDMYLTETLWGEVHIGYNERAPEMVRELYRERKRHALSG